MHHTARNRARLIGAAAGVSLLFSPAGNAQADEPVDSSTSSVSDTEAQTRPTEPEDAPASDETAAAPAPTADASTAAPQTSDTAPPASEAPATQDPVVPESPPDDPAPQTSVVDTPTATTTITTSPAPAVPSTDDDTADTAPPQDARPASPAAFAPTTIGAQQADSPEPAPLAVMAPATAPLTAPEPSLFGMLALFGAPLAAGSTSPAAPAPWILGWWSRRFQQKLLNSTPTTATPTVSDGGDTDDRTYAVAVPASDADGDALTYTVTSAPRHGTVTAVPGGYRYVADPGFSGVDTFQVRVSDASAEPHLHGLDSLFSLFTGVSAHETYRTVSVVVDASAPTNQAPTVTGDNGTPAPDGTVSGTITASDPDGDPLTYTVNGVGYTRGTTLTTDTGDFVWDAATNGYTFTPSAAARHRAAADDADADDTAETFVIVASDGRGGTSTTTLTTVITGDNTAPVIAGPTTGAVDRATGTTVGTVTASDGDADPLRYAVTTAPSHGSVEMRPDGSFVYTPDGTDRSPAPTDSFTVTVDDGHGGTVAVPVSIAAFPRYFLDVDPQNLFWDPSDADTAAGAVPGSPVGVVEYSVDGSGAVVVHNTGTTPISVLQYNTNGGTQNIAEYVAIAPGSSHTFGVSATGSALDQLVVQTPRDDQGRPVVAGSIVRRSDGSFFQNTVPRVNAAPTLTASDQVDAASSTTGRLTVDDADDDPLTYTVDGMTYRRGETVYTVKGAFTWNSTDDGYTFTPSAAARHAASAPGATADDKSTTITIAVDDGFGGLASTTVTAPITADNSVPLVTESNRVDSPSSSTGVLTASDPDGDPITYTVNGVAYSRGQTVTTPKGSFVWRQDGTYTYTPTYQARHRAAADGASSTDKTDVVVIRAADGHGGTAATDVSFAIVGANSPAQLDTTTPVGAVVAAGTSTGSLAPRASDVDHDPLTFSAPSSTTTGGGSVTVAPDGTFVYTAPIGGSPTATDSFTVHVSDGHGPATVAVVTVPARNTAPQFTAGNRNDGATTNTGTMTVADADGHPLTYTVNGQAYTRGSTVSTPQGTFVWRADGTYTFTPSTAARHAASATDAGPDQVNAVVTLVASDGIDSTTSTLVLPLVGTNSAPVLTVPPAPAPAGGSAVVSGGFTASDAQNDPLRFRVTDAAPTGTPGTYTTAAGGTVVLDPTARTYTYTPTAAMRLAASDINAPASTRTDTFTIEVDDGHGGVVTRLVTVTVDPVTAAGYAVGPVVLGPDGTRYLTAYDSSGSTTNVTVVSPDGTIGRAQIPGSPSGGVQLDPSGDAYLTVADQGSYSVYRLGDDGRWTSLNGTGTPGTTARPLTFRHGPAGTTVYAVTQSATTSYLSVISPTGTTVTGPILGATRGYDVAADGTVALTTIESTANGDVYRTSYISPTGQVTTHVLGGGPVTDFNKLTVGPTGIPYYVATSGSTTTVHTITPSGPHSYSATGDATSRPTFGADGTAYLPIRNFDNSTTVIIMTPNGSTTRTVTGNAVDGVVFAGETPYLVTQTISGGCLITDLRPGGGSSTCTVTGTPTSGTAVGADGTVYVRSYVSSPTSGWTWYATPVVPGGSPRPSVVTSLGALPTMLPNGSAAYVGLTGDQTSGYTTPVTIVRPDGTSTDLSFDGRYYNKTVGDTGILYLTPLTAGPPIVMIDGTTPRSIPIPAGTLYQVVERPGGGAYAYGSTGSSTTFVMYIDPDGTTRTITIPGSPVNQGITIAPDGSATITTIAYLPNGSVTRVTDL